MENKIYSYQNRKYKLKPLTLGVLSAAAPLLAKFRKLQAKYTADIDISCVQKAENRINELRLSIDQLKEAEENIIENRISELEQKLSEARNDLENDNKLQQQKKLYNECTALAMIGLLGEKELINSFLNGALTPVNMDDRGAEIIIDNSIAESTGFVKEVIRDFFVLIAGEGKISAG